MEEDSAIVQRVKEGDTDAYEALVVRYERAAKMAVLRIVRDRHLAEDVLQEALVKAYENLDTLRDGSKFGPWLMRITTREAVRCVRGRRCMVSLESTGEPMDSMDTELHRDGREHLIELVNRLPIHERLVFALHHLDGHGTADVAATTGRRVETVKKQLSRAMRRLRRWAGREEWML